MLRFVLALLSFALIAGVLGFGGVLTTSAGLARSLCFFYLGASVLALAGEILRS